MLTMNPLALLDSLLGDWASPRVRRLIHGLILLAGIIASIWLAADQDWKEFVGALVATLYAASNVANTPANPEDEEYTDLDDLPYDDGSV